MDFELEIGARVQKALDGIEKIETKLKEVRGLGDIRANVTVTNTTQLDTLQNKLFAINQQLDLIAAFRFPNINLPAALPPINLNVNVSEFDREITKDIADIQRSVNAKGGVKLKATIEGVTGQPSSSDSTVQLKPNTGLLDAERERIRKGETLSVDLIPGSTVALDNKINEYRSAVGYDITFTFKPGEDSTVDSKIEELKRPDSGRIIDFALQVGEGKNYVQRIIDNYKNPSNSYPVLFDFLRSEDNSLENEIIALTSGAGDGAWQIDFDFVKGSSDALDTAITAAKNQPDAVVNFLLKIADTAEADFLQEIGALNTRIKSAVDPVTIPTQLGEPSEATRVVKEAAVQYQNAANAEPVSIPVTLQSEEEGSTLSTQIRALRNQITDAVNPAGRGYELKLNVSSASGTVGSLRSRTNQANKTVANLKKNAEAALNTVNSIYKATQEQEFPVEITASLDVLREQLQSARLTAPVVLAPASDVGAGDLSSSFVDSLSSGIAIAQERLEAFSNTLTAIEGRERKIPIVYQSNLAELKKEFEQLRQEVIKVQVIYEGGDLPSPTASTASTESTSLQELKRVADAVISKATVPQLRQVAGGFGIEEVGGRSLAKALKAPLQEALRAALEAAQEERVRRAFKGTEGIVGASQQLFSGPTIKPLIDALAVSGAALKAFVGKLGKAPAPSGPAPSRGFELGSQPGSQFLTAENQIKTSQLKSTLFDYINDIKNAIPATKTNVAAKSAGLLDEVIASQTKILEGYLGPPGTPENKSRFDALNEAEKALVEEVNNRREALLQERREIEPRLETERQARKTAEDLIESRKKLIAKAVDEFESETGVRASTALSAYRRGEVPIPDTGQQTESNIARYFRDFNKVASEAAPKINSINKEIASLRSQSTESAGTLGELNKEIRSASDIVKGDRAALASIDAESPDYDAANTLLKQSEERRSALIKERDAIKENVKQIDKQIQSRQQDRRSIQDTIKSAKSRLVDRVTSAGFGGSGALQAARSYRAGESGVSASPSSRGFGSSAEFKRAFSGLFGAFDQLKPKLDNLARNEITNTQAAFAKTVTATTDTVEGFIRAALAAENLTDAFTFLDAAAKKEASREIKTASDVISRRRGRINDESLSPQERARADAEDFAAFQENQARARRGRRRERTKTVVSEVLTGGGFPALFGAGPGSSLGGAIGGASSLVGVGGFAGSLVGSLIGQYVDQFSAAAQETGRTLNTMTGTIDLVAEKSLFASKEQELYAKQLQAVGRGAEAAAIAQKELQKVIGAQGIDDLRELGVESKKMAQLWDELNLSMQAFAAGPLTDVIKLINSALGGFAGGGRVRALVGDLDQENQIKAFEQARSFVDQQLGKGAATNALRGAFGREVKVENGKDAAVAISALISALDPDAIRELANRFEKDFGDLRKQAAPTPLTPEELKQQAESRVNQLIKTEDQRRSEADYARQLESEIADFRQQKEETILRFRERAKDIEKEIADFRESLEDRLFDKRISYEREVAQLQRDTAQLAIEQTSNAIDEFKLGFTKLNPDFDTGLVDAAQAYIRTVSEGQADIEQREAEHRLDMEEIQREGEKLKLEVERKVEEINLKRLEYEKDVKKAIAENEKKLGDFWISVEERRYNIAKARIEMEIAAGNAMAVAGALGTGGGASALRDLIGRKESFGGNYGAVNYYGTTETGRVEDNLTSQTIDQIMERQRTEGLYAVGKYQFIPETLRALLQGRMGEIGNISGNMAFSPDVQDRLADAYIKYTLKDFLSGNQKIEDAMKKIRDVWHALREESDTELRAVLMNMKQGGAAMAAGASSMGAQLKDMIPGVIEYRTGDPSWAGRGNEYDPSGHGGARAHEHVAFVDRVTRDQVRKEMEKRGWTVTSADRDTRTYHGSGQALDFGADPNAGNFGFPRNAAGDSMLAQKFRKDLAEVMGGSVGLGRVGGSGITSYAPPSLDPSLLAPLRLSLSDLPAAPGMTDMSDILAMFDTYEERLKKVRMDAKEIANALIEAGNEKALTSLLDAAQRKAAELLSPINDITKEINKQARIDADYTALISEGRLPAEAQLLADLKEKLRFAKKEFDLQLDALRAVKLKLEESYAETKDAEKRLEILERIRGVEKGISEVQEARDKLPEAGAKAKKSIEDSQSSAKRFRDAKNALVGDLNEITDPVNQLVDAATNIGDAFAQAFSDIVSGSKSAKEGLADLLNNIGGYLLDQVAQMLSKKLTLGILDMFDFGEVATPDSGEERLAAGASTAAMQLEFFTAALRDATFVLQGVSPESISLNAERFGDFTNGLSSDSGFNTDLDFIKTLDIDLAQTASRFGDISGQGIQKYAGAFGGEAGSKFGSIFTNALGGLFGNMGGQGGLGGTLISAIPSLIGAFSGGFGEGFPLINGPVLPLFGGLRASGGPVRNGMTYLVGEKGPELFTPSSSGNIVSNEDLAEGARATMSSRGGGGENGNVNSVVNVNIDSNGNAQVDANQGSEMGRMIEKAVVATIQRERRPGGILNRRT